ncbi:hypothetical protein LLH03_01700, partial [bacterium]|nr:hypothetical protein [bacterium]
MRRLAILMLLPFTVGVAVAAGTDKDTVTVTFGLSAKSDFALAWPPDHKETYDVDTATGTVTVPIALRLYLTTVPEGYTRGDTVWEKTYGEEQLTPQGIRDAQGEIQTQQGWPRIWMKDPNAPTWDAGKSQIIMDHNGNLETLLGRLAGKETMLNGARMRMGRQKLSADLGGLAFKLRVSVLKTTAPDGKTSVTMAEGYLEWVLPEVTVTLKGACDNQQLITFSVKAPTKTPSEEGTTQTKDVTSLFAKLGWPDYALTRSVGYDPVVGVAVPRNGPKSMVGIVASFEEDDDRLDRPDDWRRIGVLGGYLGGSDENWLLGLSYKIGSRAHLYGGVAFGNSDNNTSSSVAFGMAFSAGDIVGAAINKKSEDTTATEPTKAKVALAPASTSLARSKREDELKGPRVCLVRGANLAGMGAAGLLVEGANSSARALQPVPLRYDCRAIGEGLSDGTKVVGAWGCDRVWSEQLKQDASKLWCSLPLNKLEGQKPREMQNWINANGDGIVPTTIELRLNNAQGRLVTPDAADGPLVLKKGIVYFCEIVLPAAKQAPQKTPPSGKPQPQPTPARTPTGPQWWLRGQAEPRPGQMVSIVITATSEKKVGIGTLQSRYSVPAQVDADGFFAVLLPQLDEGQPYRIEITREGSDAPFVV